MLLILLLYDAALALFLLVSRKKGEGEGDLHFYDYS